MATIWIDLDNTPHVPFFQPLIREFEGRGHQVLLTARDAFQVWELVQQMGLKCHRVGRHYGKRPLFKAMGFILRALQLMPIVLRHRPDLALSHGARSQLLVARMLRIPSVSIDDYEHSRPAPFARPAWLLIPEAIPKESVADFAGHVRHYPGIKEDVYAGELQPDRSILDKLHLKDNEIVVTVRPPATEAHYHSSESDTLFNEFMDRLCATPGARAVLLPRNQQQKRELKEKQPHWFKDDKVVVPESAVNGLNLVWHSDLVVSGGGTMNREAAALGVPVYSIFRGKIGAVDQQLEKEGRLVLIKDVEDVRSKISLNRRSRSIVPGSKCARAGQQIVDHVEDILEECNAA
jgi:uncharacterized protein